MREPIPCPFIDLKTFLKDTGPLPSDLLAAASWALWCAGTLYGFGIVPPDENRIGKLREAVRVGKPQVKELSAEYTALYVNEPFSFDRTDEANAHAAALDLATEAVVVWDRPHRRPIGLAESEYLILWRAIVREANRAAAERNPKPEVEIDAPWPEYMSAADLAQRLGLAKEATRKRLERLARNRDCFIENESPRKGEARRLYRVTDVLPELQKDD